MALDASARIWSYGLGRTAPVQVENKYRTNLFMSDNGTPQRRATDDRPRKTYTWPTVVSDTWYRTLLRELHKYKSGLWGFPDWTRKELSTTAMANAASSIDVATVENWMVVGESVILRDNERSEAYEIQTVSAPTITFTTSNTGVEWPIGTAIHPAMPGYLREPTSGARRIKDYIALDTVFDVQPTADFYIEPSAAPTTYNGNEVFAIPPARVSPFSHELINHLETVDYFYGAKAYFQPIAYFQERFTLTWVGCNADTARLIEDVYVRARGGSGEFYMPTWEQDLIVNSTATSGTNVIDVVGEDVADSYYNDTVYKAVAIRFKDNTWEFNAVKEMTAAGGLTTMTMIDNWSKNIVPSEIRHMSWMPACRFASDNLTAVWQLRERTASIQLTIETLEDRLTRLVEGEHGVYTLTGQAVTLTYSGA